MKIFLKTLEILIGAIGLAFIIWGAVEVRAEDIEIGKLNLTKNQTDRMSDLQKGSDKIKGFSIVDGMATVHTLRPLTSSERSLLIADLQAIPDSPTGLIADKQDFQNSPFKGLDPDQAEAWVDSNVNTLPDVKAALKKMARVQSYLLRRSDLDQ